MKLMKNNVIRILELFAGIGACSKAFENLDIPHAIVDAVEIDKYAIKSFNAIHHTNFQPSDIRDFDKDIKVDLIMHGSPCQDFSIAGKNAGGDEGSGTRSSLMYETLRIVEKLQPKYVIWENVKNILSQRHVHNWDAYAERMEELGYTNYCQILNAKDYGIPQNRERVFTISIKNYYSSTYKCTLAENFNFPNKIPLKKKLKDFLESDVDKKYYLDEKFESLIKINDNYVMMQGGSIGKMHDISRRAYYTDYVAPTIPTCSGGNIQPKIAIKTANKKGFDLGTYGDGVDLSYPNSTTRRGRVGHSVSKTLATTNLQGCIDKNYRIRKLTPRECYRLMGFTDQDYDNAAKVCSETQLYKQAGNSIVVNVLEEIIKNLI